MDDVAITALRVAGGAVGAAMMNSALNSGKANAGGSSAASDKDNGGGGGADGDKKGDDGLGTGKNITYWGGVALLVNNITGGGMVLFPSIMQQAGWFPVVLVLVVVAILSAIGSFMIIESMAMMPGNKNFDKRAEYATLSQYYLDKRWYYFTQLFYQLSMGTNNISMIIQSCQVMDTTIVAIVGRSCGFPLFTPNFSFSCPTPVEGFSTPFGNIFLIPLGWYVTLMLVLPWGFLDLEGNIIVQKGGFLLLFLILGIWSGIFISQGLKPSRLPTVGSDFSGVLGTIVFNWTMIVSVPSWVNEKRPSVSIVRSFWVCSCFSICLFVALGVLGAMAFDPWDPSLTILDEVYSVGSKLAVISYYLFPVCVNLTSIPAISVMQKYNLVNSGFCSVRTANFLAVILPWLLAIPLYTGNGYQLLVNWSGIVINSYVNFIAPPVIYIVAINKFNQDLMIKKRKRDHVMALLSGRQLDPRRKNLGEGGAMAFDLAAFRAQFLNQKHMSSSLPGMVEQNDAVSPKSQNQINENPEQQNLIEPFIPDAMVTDSTAAAPLPPPTPPRMVTPSFSQNHNKRGVTEGLIEAGAGFDDPDSISSLDSPNNTIPITSGTYVDALPNEIFLPHTEPLVPHLKTLSDDMFIPSPTVDSNQTSEMIMPLLHTTSIHSDSNPVLVGPPSYEAPHYSPNAPDSHLVIAASARTAAKPTPGQPDHLVNNTITTSSAVVVKNHEAIHGLVNGFDDEEEDEEDEHIVSGNDKLFEQQLAHALQAKQHQSFMNREMLQQQQLQQHNGDTITSLSPRSIDGTTGEEKDVEQMNLLGDNIASHGTLLAENNNNNAMAEKPLRGKKKAFWKREYEASYDSLWLNRTPQEKTFLNVLSPPRRADYTHLSLCIGAWILWVLVFPWKFVFYFTIPDLDDLRYQSKRPLFVFISFLLCSAWLGILTYLIVVTGESFAISSGIHAYLIGIFVIGSGIRLPWLIQSLMDAQVNVLSVDWSFPFSVGIFELLFALPLAWLIYAMANSGSSIKIFQGDIAILELSLFILCTLSALILLEKKWHIRNHNKIIMFGMGGLYLFFLIEAGLLNYGLLISLSDCTS